MDPVLVIVILKGVGMLLAIGGGVLIAKYGFHLYRDGAGSGRDHAAFEVGPVKLTAHSVGSVVMASAFLWAWAGVALSPNLEKQGEDLRIYSFNTPDLRLSSLEVVVDSQDVSPDSPKDLGQLKALLKEGLARSGEKGSPSVVELDGERAHYDLESIRALKSETGEYVLTTRVHASGKEGVVAFEAAIGNNKITFVPAGATVSRLTAEEPNKLFQPTPQSGAPEQ